MSNNNRISLTIPQETVDQVKQLYGQIHSLLAPHLVSLSSDERLELPKMGEKSIPFVTKGSEYLQIEGNVIPPYVDKNELTIDLKGFETIRQILQIAKPTVDMLEDTMMLSGSEAYVAVLSYYNYLKGAAKAGVPGAKTIFDDLSSRFPRRSQKKVE